MSFSIVSFLGLSSDDIVPLAHLTPVVTELHHNTSPAFNSWLWGDKCHPGLQNALLLQLKIILDAFDVTQWQVYSQCSWQWLHMCRGKWGDWHIQHKWMLFNPNFFQERLYPNNFHLYFCFISNINHLPVWGRRWITGLYCGLTESIVLGLNQAGKFWH